MLALRAILFTVLMPGTAVVWIPRMLLVRETSRLELGLLRWAGLPLIVAGAAVLLACIIDFARKGHGTLAPVDPPRNLVAAGLYRYARNPMYVGVVTTVIGEALFFESKTLAIYAAIAWLIFHLFVVLYEEPHLEETFGAEYETYRDVVPRWIPRLHPKGRS